MVQVAVENFAFPDQHMEFAAMVDTGASHLTLPIAWKDRLGSFPIEEEATLQLADTSDQKGLVCGPAKIQIEGYPPFYNEILFVDSTAEVRESEFRIGTIPLAAARLSVDESNSRLVRRRYADLKSYGALSIGCAIHSGG